MPPPTKKRRIEHAAVEEIKFDSAARQEYLTGFHKRKLQRAKQAQEIAQKKAQAEKIQARKLLREDRKADLERHVQEVNAFLKPEVESDDSEDDENANVETMGEWDGIEEIPEVDHEAEYIDEDRYTMVTVEALDVSKEGLYKAAKHQDQDGQKEGDVEGEAAGDLQEAPKTDDKNLKDRKRTWTKAKPKDKSEKPKAKRKKFRYESKVERRLTRVKEKSKNSKQAKARRDG